MTQSKQVSIAMQVHESISMTSFRTARLDTKLDDTAPSVTYSDGKGSCAVTRDSELIVYTGWDTTPGPMIASYFNGTFQCDVNASHFAK
jgi:hypothetical protein